LENEVELNLQILFAGSHENISKAMSRGNVMLLRR
jgi:hypothetical protein